MRLAASLRGSVVIRVALGVMLALCWFVMAPGSAGAASCATTASGAEGIEDFASDILINADATTTVRETIRVLTRGQQLTTEIYRDFPSHFQDERGHVFAPTIHVLDARRDGKPVSYETRQLPEGLRVYLGTPDSPLPPGEYTYTLAYQVSGNIAFFGDGDQLFWPVTPTNWAVPIACATTTIQLPPGVPTIGVRATGWIGQLAAPDQQIGATVDRSGVVTYVAPGPLAGEHGLTVEVSWPQGHIQEPASVGKTWPLIGTGRTGLILLLGLVPILLYSVLAFLRVRRVPKGEPAGPASRPPDQLSPAAARFLATAAYDERALAATILDLAVKGLLTIRATAPVGPAASDQPDLECAFELVRADGHAKGPPVAPEEGSALAEIFGSKTTCRLGRESFRELRRASNEIKRLVGALYEDRYFTNNARYVVPALLLAIVTLSAAALAEINRASLDVRAAVIWLVVALALVIGTMVILGTALLVTRFTSRSHALSVGGIALAAYLIPFFVALVAFTQIAGTPVGSIVLIGAIGIVLALLRKALATPTRDGHLSRRRVNAFRDFLVTTGPDSPDDDRERRWNGVWEAYVPYAVALEVDERWVWPLLSEAPADDVDSERGRRGVGWYQTAGTVGGPADLTTSLGDQLTAAVRESLRGPLTIAEQARGTD